VFPIQQCFSYSPFFSHTRTASRDKQYLDKRLFVNLQGNRKVSGTLRGYDIFLNIVLDDAQEERSPAERIPIGTVVSSVLESFAFSFFLSPDASPLPPLCSGNPWKLDKLHGDPRGHTMILRALFLPPPSFLPSSPFHHVLFLPFAWQSLYCTGQINWFCEGKHRWTDRARVGDCKRETKRDWILNASPPHLAGGTPRVTAPVPN
jgi:small nuclear ribonucleoprotein (snRNP)-like protein